MSRRDPGTNGVRALRGYSVVDGGDVVGITQRGGVMVRIPAWTVIGDNLILGAHPADTMPPNVDVIANVDSFRFYDIPDGVVYLHFTCRDTDAVPDATELDADAAFLNDLRAAAKTVFVHCHLGLNRSALLTGLMLIDEGYPAEDGIDLMRDVRSPVCSRTGRSRATCSRWTGRVEPTRLQSFGPGDRSPPRDSGGVA